MGFGVRNDQVETEIAQHIETTAKAEPGSINVAQSSFIPIDAIVIQDGSVWNDPESDVVRFLRLQLSSPVTQIESEIGRRQFEGELSKRHAQAFE